MSKKGLPTNLQMRHDSHYVDDLAKTIRTVGRRIAIELLEPNPEQPRTEIGDLSELSDSIKQKGVLEPILVKPDSKSGKWLIIAGERRWRAANLAGLSEVPCIELDIDEKDIAEIALIENLQRKDLTLWEEADGFAYLIKKFGYTHEEIAKKIGKSRTTVTESLSIAGLPPEIRDKCRKAEITTKSSLLEVARQFDESAMHAFLDQSHKRKPEKTPTALRSAALKNETVGNKQKNSDNLKNILPDSEKTFEYSTRDGELKIQISFNSAINHLNGSKKMAVLEALKKIFNELKSTGK